MNPNCFIHIRSSKFPVLLGEDEELVNEGMYGKALAQYLQSQLRGLSYDIPSFCCEDWGWWLEVAGQPFSLGVCIYGTEGSLQKGEHCVMVSEKPRRRWSWSRFGFIDTAPRVNQLFADLRKVFESDGEVQVLGCPEEYPLD
jgi:hypothetical protein